MKSYKQYLFELGDVREFKWEVEEDEVEDTATYKVEKMVDGDRVDVYAFKRYGTCEIGFRVNDYHANQKEAKSPIKIIALVMSAVDDLWKKYIEPDKEIGKVYFTSFVEEQNELYDTFAKKIAAKTGWNYRKVGKEKGMFILDRT